MQTWPFCTSVVKRTDGPVTADSAPERFPRAAVLGRAPRTSDIFLSSRLPGLAARPVGMPRGCPASPGWLEDGFLEREDGLRAKASGGGMQPGAGRAL
mgnify:CR=1 FL=1